jgi:hypothetical protein
MKKILYYLLVFTCLIFTACNDWLDVQPRTTFKQEKLFETEGGFKDVLTGAYIKLKEPALYGTELTMTTIEYLAQHWDAKQLSKEAALKAYDYEDARVKNTMSGIYVKLYNVIVNVNSILENIDAKKDIFSKGMYELIKGEALSIRAYCHFDILRLFGPVPSGTTTAINLTYVKTVSKDTYTLSSYNQFTQFILDDLNQAENYLKRVDPIIKYSIDDLNKNVNSEDSYWAYRKFNMNYYAVLGLKARFYLWTQDKTNAYEYAKKVIDAKNEDGTEKFSFTGFQEDDYTFSSEHIFSLKTFDLEHIWNSLFVMSDLLYKSKTLIERDVFDNILTDIRYKLWDETTSGSSFSLILKKYWQNAQVSDISKQEVIPLMRLSEMYLIAIECGSLSESNLLFKKMSLFRNNNPTDFTDETDRLNRIIKEYRKEFYGEGLMFYTYKRLNIKNILWTGEEASEKTYVVPLPDTEIIKN